MLWKNVIPEGFSNLNKPKVYKRLTQQKNDKYKLSCPSEGCQILYCEKYQSETCVDGHIDKNLLSNHAKYLLKIIDIVCIYSSTDFRK